MSDQVTYLLWYSKELTHLITHTYHSKLIFSAYRQALTIHSNTISNNTEYPIQFAVISWLQPISLPRHWIVTPLLTHQIKIPQMHLNFNSSKIFHMTVWINSLNTTFNTYYFQPPWPALDYWRDWIQEGSPLTRKS